MRSWKSFTGIIALSSMAFAATSASAALNAYMTIKGQKQSEIKGSVTQKGREGKIMVIAMDHEVVSPRDPQSGLATGKRMHKPLTVTLEWDRATPLLYNALFSNETLTDVKIEFYQPQLKAASGTGTEQQYMTIRLMNANIASIRSHMPNNKNPELMKYTESTDVSFTYQKIEITYMDGGITSGDNWESHASTAPDPNRAQAKAAQPARPARTTGRQVAVLPRRNEAEPRAIGTR